MLRTVSLICNLRLLRGRRTIVFLKICIMNYNRWRIKAPPIAALWSLITAFALFCRGKDQ